MKTEQEIRDFKNILAEIENTTIEEAKDEISLCIGVLDWIVEDLSDEDFQMRFKADLTRSVDDGL